MRIPLVAGNWKMNTTIAEAINLASELRRTLDSLSGLEKLICPPFVSLLTVKEILKGSSIELGAQNVYFEEKGAYTGEVSALMLAGICRFVIIGHSERRQYFGETDALISKKVAAVLKNNLSPILCVGENLNEFESRKTKEVITRQITGSLTGIEKADRITIAYEPVWAIGTGKAANGKQANETISLIRSLIEKKYGSGAAANMRILYGGSVTAANIAEFVSEPDIDGALVGGASLKAAEFTGIVRITAQARRII
jgi:triosephosphate isomerase